jgi:hypothetical protein
MRNAATGKEQLRVTRKSSVAMAMDGGDMSAAIAENVTGPIEQYPAR